MTMRPSEIVAMYRVASRCAARIGQEYVLDERRLEPSFSQEQIDGIFAEIEYVAQMESQLEIRLAALDTLPSLAQKRALA
jgi:hypothetical protein